MHAKNEEATSVDTSPQIVFQLVNAAGSGLTANVIYITTDVTYNELTLQVGLTSGSVTLTPGTITDPSTPPTSGTVFYLDLSQLQLSPDVLAGLKLSADGFSFKTFPASSVVGVTPTVVKTLSAGTSGGLSITISGMEVPKALGTPTVQLYVTYYGVPAVQGMFSSFQVALVARPDERSGFLPDVLAVGLDQSTIVSSNLPLRRAENALSLQLSPGATGTVVKAGPSTVFSVSFVYGATGDTFGYGALTDVANACNIVAAAGLNADGWTIAANLHGQSPSWTLQPPDGAPIVGSGVQAIVAFDFTNIVTTYQPGPTAMVIAFANVPGYADGVYTLVLNKVPHVAIDWLKVTPNPTYFRNGKATVTVSWLARNATSLTLTQNYKQLDVTGKTHIPVDLTAESTVLNLVATRPGGSVVNRDSATQTATALPVINSFTGAPLEIYCGSASHDATFAWAVDTPDDVLVSLTSTGDAFGGQTFNATGTTNATLTGPQVITLAPNLATPSAALTRKLVVSAFKPQVSAQTAPSATTDVAFSPTAPFVALLSRSQNSVLVTDTVSYAVQQTLQVGKRPTSLAISQDGALLVTTNSGSADVSLIAVTAQGTGLPSFSAATSVALPATPSRAVITPDRQRVFVTVGTQAGASGQVVSLVRSGHGYAIEGTVYVGAAPAGICFDASGTRLFVANSSNKTVSVVALDQSGALGSVVDTIEGLPGSPVDVAATSSGKQLLIACPQQNAIVVVDPNYPNTGSRNTVTVGKGPRAIALTPGGGYALVANQLDATVSLLSTWGPPASAAVAGSPIPVGQRPYGIAASQDGLMAAVATEDASGFGLITLETYVAAPKTVSTPNQPTDVAAAPDGSVVFAWHDAAVPAAGHLPPGILVYNLTYGQISAVLASQPILGCVFSPVASDQQAIAITQGAAALSLIRTTDLTVTSVDLSSVAKGSSPLSIAIAGDGQTLFVLLGTSSRGYGLLVLTKSSGAWTPGQTVPLYQGSGAGVVMLRSTPDGSAVFVVDPAASSVRVVRRASDGTYSLDPAVVPADASALDATILPDGSTAYVLNAGAQYNTVTVVDVATLAVRTAAIPQTFVNLRGLIASPDGRRLYATDTNAGALRVLDPASLRILQTLPLNAQPSAAAGADGLAILPDASRIFTANTRGQGSGGAGAQGSLAVIDAVQMGAPSGLGAAA
ncbi:beta-propeller fold lactonase family protein [Sorangium sp. So ce394]|uniref:beta-propeller fold lactonase family protein n=1 Tax=Sorangium sp. So ce394 TaxID=3133310 RepID=UPI003F5C7854